MMLHLFTRDTHCVMYTCSKETVEVKGATLPVLPLHYNFIKKTTATMPGQQGY